MKYVHGKIKPRLVHHLAAGAGLCIITLTTSQRSTLPKRLRLHLISTSSLT
jgi:hypothetical protein